MRDELVGRAVAAALPLLLPGCLEEDCWLINFNDYTYEMHKVGIDRWRLCWDDFESWPIDITTRYQFCQLAAALGIPKKGES